jgi:hypothetical protein
MNIIIIRDLKIFLFFFKKNKDLTFISLIKIKFKLPEIFPVIYHIILFYKYLKLGVNI